MYMYTNTSNCVLLARDLVTEYIKPGSHNGAALIIASAAGDLSSVKELSKVQKEVHQDLPLQEMLVAATDKSHANVAEYCLQQGALIDDDVNFAAFRGRSADLFEILFPRNIFGISQHPEYLSDLLDDAIWVGWFKPPYDAASNPEGAKLAAFLLARGAKISEDTVFGAASHQSVEFMECLLANGATLEGSGALHIAASKGRLEMTRWLLDHGADVNGLVLKDILGDLREPEPQMGFALHYAVTCGRVDIVKLLLERGADTTLRNQNGQSVFEVGVSGRDNESRQSISQLLREIQEHQEV